MSGPTRRVLEERVADLQEEDGEPISFTEFYVFYHYCVVVHESLSGGPPSEEFFGPDRPALPNTDYWKGMIRIWDGDDDPPIDDDELRARVADHRQEQAERLKREHR